jgi:hypothetical protein
MVNAAGSAACAQTSKVDGIRARDGVCRSPLRVPGAVADHAQERTIAPRTTEGVVGPPAERQLVAWAVYDA